MGTAATVRGGADTSPGWAQAGTLRGTGPEAVTPGRWGRKWRCWTAAQEAGSGRAASAALEVVEVTGARAGNEMNLRGIKGRGHSPSASGRGGRKCWPL